jgi:hypothetical protein
LTTCPIQDNEEDLETYGKKGQLRAVGVEEIGNLEGSAQYICAKELASSGHAAGQQEGLTVKESIF